MAGSERFRLLADSSGGVIEAIGREIGALGQDISREILQILDGLGRVRPPFRLGSQFFC